MTTSGYNPSYAQNADPVGEDIQKFISLFFEISDNPKRNESWVNCFTKDAEVLVGPEKGKGEAGE